MKKRTENNLLGETMIKKLTKKRNRNLVEREIEKGIESVGYGILEVYEWELWNDGTYDSFEDYCLKRWGFKKSRAYQLVETARIHVNLSTIVESIPYIDSHLLEIGKAPHEIQPKIVAGVLEVCELEKRTPTARDYRAAVKSFVEPTNGEHEKEEEVVEEEVVLTWEANKSDVDKFRRLANELINATKDAPDSPGYELIRALSNRIQIDLGNVKAAYMGCVPYKTCPYCLGNDSDCDGCSSRGWVNKPDFNSAPKEMQDEVEKISSGGRK